MRSRGSQPERARTLRRVKVGLVLLIGASAGLITLQWESSLASTVTAVGGGLLVGIVLAWYLVPDVGPDTHRRFQR